MDPTLSDTSAEAERVLVELSRKRTPARPLECVATLDHELDFLAEARIRAQDGETGDREMRPQLGTLRIDRDLMIRAFDQDPVARGY